jgi:hypothetical protein
MNIPDDILYHISEYLIPREIFVLKKCTSKLNESLSADIFWQNRVGKVPQWIHGPYDFAKKLKNSRQIQCFKCEKQLDRFCALFLCKCVQTEHWKRRYTPRWHPNCVFNTDVRSVGNKRCPICDKLVMYVQITSFP